MRLDDDVVVPHILTLPVDAVNADEDNNDVENTRNKIVLAVTEVVMRFIFVATTLK